MDIGFVGLGKMGSAMARTLAKAGHAVRAWNRSPHDLDGIRSVRSVDEVFRSDVVFTMLSDDAAVRDVVLASDVLTRARADVVHVVTSTISTAFAGELVARHEAAGIAYVAAPVFGRPDVAEAGQLAVVAAGPAAALERVRPLLDAIGRRTWVLGSDPKQANAAKIAGNMMIAMAIEAIAEAVAIAEGSGVTAEGFLNLMMQTQFGGSRAYENYGGKIVAEDFEPGFLMRLGLKDLGLAAEAAGAAGTRLPMLDALRARMTSAVEAGMGEKDWSAVAAYTLRGGS